MTGPDRDKYLPPTREFLQVNGKVRKMGQLAFQNPHEEFARLMGEWQTENEKGADASSEVLEFLDEGIDALLKAHPDVDAEVDTN